MSPENFTYWLSGFFEISHHSDGPKALNEEQVEEIRNHLNLVLKKVTPEISSTKETQVPPPFLEQFKIDEEEKRKYKKLTQPYGGYKPAREPGRAC